MFVLNAFRDKALELNCCMWCGKKVMEFEGKRDRVYYLKTATCPECHEEQTLAQRRYDWGDVYE